MVTNSNNNNKDETSPLIPPFQDNLASIVAAEDQPDRTPTTEDNGGGHSGTYEMIADAVMDIQNAVIVEYNNVKDAFMDEFHQHEEDAYFLDMALTRGLSILPGDLEQAAADDTVNSAAAAVAAAIDAVNVLPTWTETIIEATPADTTARPTTETELANAAPAKTYPSLSAYLLFASAVISLSAIGPLLELQDDVHPAMKLYWRQIVTSIMLLPLALHSFYKHGWNSRVDWCFFFITAAAYAVNCGGFVMALDYTSVGNAVIFGNSQALIMLIAKVFMGHHLTVVEATGAMVASLGAVLCSRDSSSMDSGNSSTNTDNDGNGSSSLCGDLLALFSGFGGVVYLVFAKQVRPCMTLYVFMFLMMFTSSCLVLIFMLLTRQELSFDRNITIGMFGWMNLAPHRLGLEIYMVVICNLLGSMGYVRAMQDFDNLVIAVASLMEPVVAELLALALGVGTLPGLEGWIGNGLVMGGTLAVVSAPQPQQQPPQPSKDQGRC
jgi:drug/metabolite transporter (DMT)-like permease